MNYITKTITVNTLASSADYAAGDYGLLYYDNRTGSVSYTAPLILTKSSLYDADNMLGWGYQTWGTFPWGYGQTPVSIAAGMTTPGLYIFVIAAFTGLGNYTIAGVAEKQYYVCLAPTKPARPGTVSQSVAVFRLNR